MWMSGVEWVESMVAMKPTWYAHRRGHHMDIAVVWLH